VTAREAVVGKKHKIPATRLEEKEGIILGANSAENPEPWAQRPKRKLSRAPHAVAERKRRRELKKKAAAILKEVKVIKKRLQASGDLPKPKPPTPPQPVAPQERMRPVAGWQMRLHSLRKAEEKRQRENPDGAIFPREQQHGRVDRLFDEM
jgi:hypothetical protein